LAGWAIAPVTGALSRIRHARMFHPSGVVYDARVVPVAIAGEWGQLASRLEGEALVRLSSAWWKHREWRDVLGCAIRFGGGEAAQDLLFATIKHPWTMPFAPLTTHHHDFLDNQYYAVSPFRSEDAGAIDLRLRPSARSERGGTREERLARAVEERAASFALEGRSRHLPIEQRMEWAPICLIELVRASTVDQETLRFDPFQSGCGIEPAGFVHALRIGTYRASQRGRAASP
jgi:hypothetical protein